MNNNLDILQKRLKFYGNNSKNFKKLLSKSRENALKILNYSSNLNNTKEKLKTKKNPRFFFKLKKKKINSKKKSIKINIASKNSIQKSFFDKSHSDVNKTRSKFNLFDKKLKNSYYKRNSLEKNFVVKKKRVMTALVKSSVHKIEKFSLRIQTSSKKYN